MKRLGKFLSWVLISVALLIAATALFVELFDWNRLKPMLNEKVSDVLQRPFAIEGNLSAGWQREDDNWFPSLHVSAEQIRLGNPEWAKGEHFVFLQRGDIGLALLPLLKQEINVRRINLILPDARLERLKDGRNNWTFALGGENDTEQKPSAWTLDIGTIGFDKGEVHFSDQQLQSDFEIQVTPLGEPISFADIIGKESPEQNASAVNAVQDFAFGWQAKGRYKGQSMQGEGKIGGILALRSADRPFPIEADVHAGRTRIRLAGTLTDPTHFGALNLRLRLSGATLSDLYRIAGVTLPDTPPYATNGLLEANLKAPGGMVFHYRDFSGTIGKSDIHGNLTYAMHQPRPKLSGSLTSNQLLFADLAPLIGADAGSGTSAEKGQTGAASSGKVLPTSEFRTDRWRVMDAEVEFTGKSIIQSKDFPFTNVHTKAVLDDGRLTLQPLRFGVAGGQLDTNIYLDGRNKPMRGHANMSLRKFELSKLFPAVESMQAALGEVNGDIKLDGSGNSVAALLGSANGEIKLLINGGQVSKSLMEIAGLNVGNYVTSKLFGDEETKINCAATDMLIEKGVMTPKLFLVDTDTSVIHMSGSVNFATEELALDISPESKNLRVLSLRSPLYVDGTFGKPQVGVKAAPLALRGVAVIALGALVGPAAGLLALTAPGEGEPENECSVVLRQFSQK